MAERDMILVGGVHGSGSTTLARNLAERFDASLISVGDRIREIGLGEIESFFDDSVKNHLADRDRRYDLLDDPVIAHIVREACEEVLNSKRVVLEGFPRNRHQVNILARLADMSKRRIVGMLFTSITDDIAAGRLVVRGGKNPQRAISHSDAATRVANYRATESDIIVGLQTVGIPFASIETTGPKDSTLAMALGHIAHMELGFDLDQQSST